MSQFKRFGRGIPIPSTISIKHELRMMEATDILVNALDNQECRPEEMSLINSDIGDKYQMTVETISSLKRHYAVI